MPTVPIVPSTPQTVPAAVIASNVTEAVLIAAYAEWNGAAASGDFLPCLEIYSDAGIRMCRVFPSTTVKAGDSAVVSYAPFPGGIGQKTITSIGSLMAGQVQIAGDFTVNTGDPGTVITWSSATFDNGSPTAFWDPANPHRLNAPVNGVYLSMINLIWDNNTVQMTGGQFATYLYHNTETVGFTTSFKKQNSSQFAQAYEFPGASHGAFVLNAGDYLIVNAYCNTGTTPMPPATVALLDLRTHAGQPPLFCHWSLILVAAL